MNKKLDVRTIVYWFIALIIFVVFFILFYKKEAKMSNQVISDSPQVVVMGDSILAYYWFSDIPLEKGLSEETGLKCGDYSLGGTSLSYLDKDGNLDYTSDAFCMSALTRAAMMKDFGYQNFALTVFRANGTDYFCDRIEKLSAVDFSKVKYLVMGYMLNDYHNGVSPTDSTGKNDEYTYEGALKKVIEDWQESYPGIKVVLIAPPTTFYETEYGYISSHDKVFGEYNIDAYREVQKSVADSYGVDVIDLDELYEGANVDNWQEYSIDGLHPSYEKHLEITRKIADYINAD